MKNNTEGLRSVMQYVKDEIYEELTVTHLQLFLEIGAHEGITIHDIKEKLDMLPGTLSRNIRTLSEYIDEEDFTRGFDLVRSEPDKQHRRRMACFLTDRGRQVYSQIINMMKADLKIGGLYADRIKDLLTSRRKSKQVDRTTCQQGCSACQNSSLKESGCRCLSLSCRGS
jgi:DNA-binding MarR family transcriptional regulator